MPSIGRRGRELGVGEGLESISGVQLPDGENFVLWTRYQTTTIDVEKLKLTLASATKSVTEMSSPVCAST